MTEVTSPPAPLQLGIVFTNPCKVVTVADDVLVIGEVPEAAGGGWPSGSDGQGCGLFAPRAPVRQWGGRATGAQATGTQGAGCMARSAGVSPVWLLLAMAPIGEPRETVCRGNPWTAPARRSGATVFARGGRRCPCPWRARTPALLAVFAVPHRLLTSLLAAGEARPTDRRRSHETSRSGRRGEAVEDEGQRLPRPIESLPGVPERSGCHHGRIPDLSSIGA